MSYCISTVIKMRLVSFFCLLLVVPQCTVKIVSTTDLQIVLNEFRQTVNQDLTNAFQTFKNLVLTFMSSVPPKESEARKTIIEGNERNMEKYAALKNAAEEADLDITLCLESFQFEDAEGILSSLHECVEDTTQLVMNRLYNFQKNFVENLLGKLYLVENFILKCEDSDQECVDNIAAAVEQYNTVSSARQQVKLDSIETFLPSYIKEVDICVEKYSSANTAWDSRNLQSFGKCVENTLRKNNRAEEF